MIAWLYNLSTNFIDFLINKRKNLSFIARLSLRHRWKYVIYKYDKQKVAKCFHFLVAQAYSDNG